MLSLLKLLYWPYNTLRQKVGNTPRAKSLPNYIITSLFRSSHFFEFRVRLANFYYYNKLPVCLIRLLWHLSQYQWEFMFIQEPIPKARSLFRMASNLDFWVLEKVMVRTISDFLIWNRTGTARNIFKTSSKTRIWFSSTNVEALSEPWPGSKFQNWGFFLFSLFWGFL